MIISIVGVLVVTAMIVRWGLHALPICHESTRNVRLVDLNENNAALSLTCPEGHLYQLVLGLDDLPYRSDMGTLPFDFAGTVRILQGATEVTSFEIDSDHVQWCNWLDNPEGICAFILSWHLSDNSRLEDYIVPGERYKLQVEFDLPPPGHTSLWLSWVQTYDENASDAELEILREDVAHKAPATQPSLQ